MYDESAKAAYVESGGVDYAPDTARVVIAIDRVSDRLDKCNAMLGRLTEELRLVLRPEEDVPAEKLADPKAVEVTPLLRQFDERVVERVAAVERTIADLLDRLAL